MIKDEPLISHWNSFSNNTWVQESRTSKRNHRYKYIPHTWPVSWLFTRILYMVSNGWLYSWYGMDSLNNNPSKTRYLNGVMCPGITRANWLAGSRRWFAYTKVLPEGSSSCGWNFPEWLSRTCPAWLAAVYFSGGLQWVGEPIQCPPDREGMLPAGSDGVLLGGRHA